MANHKQRLNAIELAANDEGKLGREILDLVCAWIDGATIDVSALDAVIEKIRTAKPSRFIAYLSEVGKFIKASV